MFPTASVARISTVCLPFPSPWYWTGLLHDAHAPPSRRHSDVADASFTVKVMLASVSGTVPVGPPAIVTTGATVSTTTTRVASGPVLPAASVALMRRVRLPSARPVKVWGLEHGAHTPASTEHAASAGSLTVNSTIAVVTLIVTAGPEVMVTIGPTVSTIHIADSTDETLPASSVARTRSVWLPSPRLLPDHGDEQGDQSSASRRHSTSAAASSTMNVTVAAVCFVSDDGDPVIVTTGAVSSTVHDRLATGPSFPAWSTANTSNWCVPPAGLPAFQDEVHDTAGTPSREQRKPTLASFALNSNTEAPNPTVPVGPAVMVVTGAIESTVHEAEAGVGSRSTPAVTARTSRVCNP
jgi:hypothetical protein